MRCIPTFLYNKPKSKHSSSSNPKFNLNPQQEEEADNSPNHLISIHNQHNQHNLNPNNFSNNHNYNNNNINSNTSNNNHNINNNNHNNHNIKIMFNKHLRSPPNPRERSTLHRCPTQPPF